MCMQDLAIQAGLKLRVVPGVSDANGRLYVSDMRRMVLMWAHASGNVARLGFQDAAGSNRLVPSDTRFTTFDSSQPQYSRESIGPFAYMPVFFICSGAAEDVEIYIYEYDASVDTVVNRMLQGGM